MKKLLGMMAVVALFAGPSLAAELTITVDDYCAVVIAPGALVMTAGEPGGSATVSTPFRVQGNTAFELTIEPNETTASVEVVAGQLGGLGYPYPTARIGGPGGAGAGIGYGVQISGDLSAAWGDANCDQTKLVISATPGLKVCSLLIASYVSGGRLPDGAVGQSGILAPPGLYRGTLTVTVLCVP